MFATKPSTLAYAALIAAAVGLGGCSTVSAPAPSGTPSLYQSQSAPGASLDKQAAASMISELRRGRGLAPVALDPALNRMAEEQAAAMASSAKLSHSTSAGSLKERIARSGYRNGGMWENIGAGHDTLADAFTGWRSSPPHLKNMLQPAAGRVGIAAARAPGSRYEVFWALVIADPNDPRPQQVASLAPPRADGPARDEVSVSERAAAAARQLPNFRLGAPGQIFVGR